MTTDPLANIVTPIYQCIGGPHDGMYYSVLSGAVPTMVIRGARYELVGGMLRSADLHELPKEKESAE